MHRPDEDPEHVHQLRVGTRRAAAALDIFSLCLPDRQYRAARKALRRIRRAAGAARDWDVFLMHLPGANWSSPRLQAGRDLVIGYALGRRSLAQLQLHDACPNYPFAFERLLAETLAELHKPKSDPEVRTLIDLALPMLSRLLRDLHQAASGDLSSYDHLHRVRIIGKQLRYAMEIFVSCFADEFRDRLYLAVEQMQEILGAANDSHVAAGHLADIRRQLETLRPDDWQRYRHGIESMRRHHDQHVKQLQLKFMEWWIDWQKSGTEDAFAALLHPAGGANGRPLEDASPSEPAIDPQPPSQTHHD
jgi:CHAD domain-containing protein